MKDTVTVGSGCGEVFVFQVGIFLQGSSACNLHSSFGILDYLYFLVYLCFCIIVKCLSNP